LYMQSLFTSVQKNKTAREPWSKRVTSVTNDKSYTYIAVLQTEVAGRA
jgi:hypothetical protein